MHKRSIYLLALNCAVAVVLVCLTFAEMDGVISPFAFAMLFATIYVTGANKILVGVAALLPALLLSHGRADVITIVFVLAVFYLFLWLLPNLRVKYAGHRAWQKYKLEPVLVFAFYLLSQSASVFFARTDLLELYIALVNVLVGVVFLAACLIFVTALRTRTNKIPWTVDQKVCAGTFLVALSLGILGIPQTHFNLHKFVVVLAILFACLAVRGQSVMILAACFGVGATLQSGNLMFVAVYGVLALAAVSFRGKTRFPSIISIIATDLVLGFYFGTYGDYGLYQSLPIAVAVFVVAIIPRRAITAWDFSKSILSANLVGKNTINRDRAGVNARLENLANVFNEMQNIYKSMIAGTAPPEEVSKMLARDLTFGVCQNCENRPNCRRNAAAAKLVDEGLEKLCLIGMQRGSVNLMDINGDLTMRCTKLNAILGKANVMLSAVKTRDIQTTRMDATKILMAGLLSGMAKLCKTFARDLGGGVIFDAIRAETIKDALLRIGIIASDVLLSHNGRGEYTVSVLVGRLDAQNTQIETVISNVTGHKLMIDAIDDAETAGYAIVTVKTAPRYALTFGVAQVSKNFNPTCGDTFSVLKITHNQSMCAICDGMGAGERANRAATLALSLVENFYRAGFPNEIIMESVNQLLILTEQEVFSAIDICVFNLTDGGVCFVKVGGVDAFIKHETEIETIESESLPMGIVEEMSPKVARAHLVGGDMVILQSDGITDSFGDRTILSNFINNIRETNPQKIADEIVAEALRRTDKIAIDDLTVLVAKICDK
jgi:stage II sporulation protein E